MTEFDRLLQQYNDINDQWMRCEPPPIPQLVEHEQLKAQEYKRVSKELGVDTPYGQLAKSWGERAEREAARLEATGRHFNLEA
jgi:hypothetical protein